MNTHPNNPTFKVPPEVYAALVNWPRRLTNEEPFFRQCFTEADVASVLDLACGTGHHAAMFASWDLSVTGLDGSPDMIRYAREHHGHSATVQWGVQRIETLGQVAGPYDAATCIGNSLSLLADVEAVHEAIWQIVRLLRPGGVAVVQVLNAWRLPDGPIQWQKLQRITVDGTERVMLKGVHRAGQRAFVDTVIHDLAANEPIQEARSTPILALEADDLADAFQTSGCEAVECLGDHAKTPYDRDTSADVIIVGRKSKQ